MQIIYRDAWGAWEQFQALVTRALTQEGIRRVGEIGAGANPMLTPAQVAQYRLEYHLVDSSAEELRKSASGFHQHVLDFDGPAAGMDRLPAFDLLFTQMTLEHVENPAHFFGNMRKLLRPGGTACLFYAVPTNLPLFINKHLPDALTDGLVKWIQPFRKQEKHGKFRAFYHWCYGPTAKNIRRIRSTGFDILEYTGFFGHSYYQRVWVLQQLEDSKTRFLLRHPNPWFCTYAQLLLQRPAETGNEARD